MTTPKHIAIISDGTGRTAKRLADAVLVHYNRAEIAYEEPVIFADVRDKKTFDRILKKIDNSYLVVFTVISEDLNAYFCNKLSQKGYLHLNVLAPMLKTMSNFLGANPEYEPGILHRIDDRYYKKIDAIGYAVEHDDGRQQIGHDCEVVVIGLSRTCKTPICMYLACNFGVRAANAPLVGDMELDNHLISSLAELEPRKIIGLTMNADTLLKVREDRMPLLTGESSKVNGVADYADYHRIKEEIYYCNRLYRDQGWQPVDVTRRAIEEISHEIMSVIDRRG